MARQALEISQATAGQRQSAGPCLFLMGPEHPLHLTIAVWQGAIPSEVL